jgi:hypothetical protein
VSVGNSPAITNCLIAGNRTQGIKGDKPSIRNCTIVENGQEGVSGAAFVLANSIVYFNGVARVWPSGPLTYSDVQGSTGGQGNMDSDPLFAQRGRWVLIADPSHDSSATDPAAMWTPGDYRLSPASPALDTGDPATALGPDETDLAGQPRIMGAAVDMGAYEREG